MAEESPSQAAEIEPEDDALIGDESTEEENPHIPVHSGPPKASQEPGAKGMLRDAIQKVMKQIAHHEKEAQKHLQQAQDLRKDLRDSFKFLQERGEKGKADSGRAQSPAVSDSESSKGANLEEAGTSGKHRRTNTKKRRNKTK